MHRFHQVPLTQTERQVGNHRAITEQPPVVRENCVVVGGFCYCCLLLSEMRWKVFISPKSFLWLFLSLADCHKCQCLHGRQQLVCKLLPTTCGAVEKLQKLWHKPETENTRLTTVPHCSGQDMLNFILKANAWLRVFADKSASSMQSMVECDNLQPVQSSFQEHIPLHNHFQLATASNQVGEHTFFSHWVTDGYQMVANWSLGLLQGRVSGNLKKWSIITLK